MFIGLDGGSTQLGSVKGTSGPTKPARPKVLGLQTTIYQLFNDGGVKAVSPSTIFAGGSRIRLGFNVNRAGFLYMVNLGSSEKVATIFPAAPTDNNQVQPGLVYQIPQQTGKSIRFDTMAGEEVILVVLAESPIPDHQQRLAQVRFERFQEPDDFFLFDTALAQPEQTVGASETSDDRDMLPVEVKLDNTLPLLSIITTSALSAE